MSSDKNRDSLIIGILVTIVTFGVVGLVIYRSFTSRAEATRVKAARLAAEAVATKEAARAEAAHAAASQTTGTTDVPMPPEEPWEAPVRPASKEGDQAIALFKIDEAFDVSLFAAEPLLANPVAFWMDAHNRCYVAECYRRMDPGGIPDNRNHDYWIEEDTTLETVAERRDMYLKHLPEKEKDWAIAADRVKLVVDRDLDGTADEATVFSGHHDKLLDGIGAGVLRHGDDVFYACIPALWRFRDADGDGVAEERESMFDGFGVRVAFPGHDLHGLRIGPDGRLYFSMGDRGYNVVSKEGKRFYGPDRGAIFRCELDGSNLELIAEGLRNPQEIAFDDHGNLFTGDNNSDSADRARIVYVVEGADIGWRMNYQYLPRRGPWVREDWWKPRHDGQAAFLLPPIANLGNGPSGFTSYAGVGMPEEFAGAFFMCDFLGSRRSGIRRFSFEEKGAGFELKGGDFLIRGPLATDADFGADGSLYVSDWVQGWSGVGKGRIYRIRHREASQAALVAETVELLRGDFDALDTDRLRTLLGHADRRVRMEAQFALVKQDDDGGRVLVDTALDQTASKLARLHAIWGVGQQARRDGVKIIPLIDLLDDADSEIRAQTAKVLGEAKTLPDGTVDRLVASLKDDAARPRFFAAQTLGRLGNQRAVDALFTMLRENDDVDVYLRHAGVVALHRLGDTDAAASRLDDPSDAVRLAALLVLRRFEDRRVASRLNDANDAIVAETVRAIYDVPIESAFADVARLDRGKRMRDPAIARRVIAARDHLGRPEDAAALAQIASRSDLAHDERELALRMLRQWGQDRRFEPVLNAHRERKGRDIAPAVSAVRPTIAKLLAEGPKKIRAEAARVAKNLEMNDQGTPLLALVKDQEAGFDARKEALTALQELRSVEAQEAVRIGLAANDAKLRGHAASVLARIDARLALPVLQGLLAEGSITEKQLAITALGEMKNEQAETILHSLLRDMTTGKTEVPLYVEVIEAAEARAKAGAESFKVGLDTYRQSLPRKDPLGPWLPALDGGSVDAGRKVFKKTSSQCERCHSLSGGKTEQAGPDLRGIADRIDRRHVLESIVNPNATIAAGFENWLIETRSGERYTGRVVDEGPIELVLETDDTERKRITLKKATITTRRATISSMPEDLFETLSLRELRDVVAFVYSLKVKKPVEKKGQ